MLTFLNVYFTGLRRFPRLKSIFSLFLYIINKLLFLILRNIKDQQLKYIEQNFHSKFFLIQQVASGFRRSLKNCPHGGHVNS